MKFSKQHINSINTLCKKHNVEKLYVFGSFTGTDFLNESDIDFLVKFKKIDLTTYFDNYMSFKERLKTLFKRNIDLVEEQTLKNPILIKSINMQKKIVYG